MSRERAIRAKMQGLLTLMAQKSDVDLIDRRLKGLTIKTAKGSYKYIGEGMMEGSKGEVMDVLPKDVLGIFDGDPPEPVLQAPADKPEGGDDEPLDDSEDGDTVTGDGSGEVLDPIPDDQPLGGPHPGDGGGIPVDEKEGGKPLGESDPADGDTGTIDEPSEPEEKVDLF